MPAQTGPIAVNIDNAGFKKLSGLAKFNATREAAGKLKTICQLPGYCPVWTGKLRREHKVVYLSGPNREHAVLAETHYAYAVHEGLQGRRANRWMNRATDALKAGGADVT
jgi:hypothetical protein